MHGMRDFFYRQQLTFLLSYYFFSLRDFYQEYKYDVTVCPTPTIVNKRRASLPHHFLIYCAGSYYQYTLTKQQVKMGKYVQVRIN